MAVEASAMMMVTIISSARIGPEKAEEVCAWEMENYKYTHRDRNDNFCLVVIRPSKLGLPEGTLAVYEMTLC